MICVWSSWCHCHTVISCFIIIQDGFTFLVSAYPNCHGKEIVKRVSVSQELVGEWRMDEESVDDSSWLWSVTLSVYCSALTLSLGSQERRENLCHLSIEVFSRTGGRREPTETSWPCLSDVKWGLVIGCSCGELWLAAADHATCYWLQLRWAVIGCCWWRYLWLVAAAVSCDWLLLITLLVGACCVVTHSSSTTSADSLCSCADSRHSSQSSSDCCVQTAGDTSLVCCHSAYADVVSVAHKVRLLCCLLVVFCTLHRGPQNRSQLIFVCNFVNK